MSCYHPLKAFDVGVTDKGKKDLKVCSYHTDHVELIDNKLVPCLGHERGAYASRVFRDYLTIPCGQCIGCRIDKSREWANRMMMEAAYHEHNVFLTLTYDDACIPRSEYYNQVTGEICDSYTLRKKDFQKFMKRLRRAVEVLDPCSGKVLDYSKVRYYACGEYGSNTFRPHYHAIIFNLNLDDLELHHIDSSGFRFYTSPTISKVWPFGYHLISNVSWETCAYVARYVTKKLKGGLKSYYDVFNIEPEFSLMSRKPGLGYQFFLDNKDEIYLDERYIIRLSTPDRAFRFKPPRYFDNLFDIEHPDVLKSIKENQQKMAENFKALKLSKTDLSYLELLEVEEENFRKRIKSLKRGDM